LSHVPESYTGGPDPLDPGNAYGEGKRAAEQLGAIYAAAAGFELSVARCFAFVGPGLPLNAHFAVGNFIRDALAGGPIRLSGDGTPSRSYQYPSDLAIWLWTLLVRGPAGRAYNVGSAHDTGLFELAHRVAGLAPSRCEVIRAREPDPRVPAPRYVPSTERIRKELGVRELVSLDEALAKTFRWHQSTQ
jgi:dTDP-glucose 4,6-dehydratase